MKRFVLQGPGIHFGPGVAVLSHDSMCPGMALEQKMRSRIALAGALAEQFFGCLLVSETAADQWLEWGLQGYVQSLFVRAVYGANEATFMRIKQREAVRPPSLSSLCACFSWRFRVDYKSCLHDSPSISNNTCVSD